MKPAVKRQRGPMPIVLMTGFAPFGGEAINPSWLAVRVFQGRRMCGHRIVTAMLPTEFARSLSELRKLLKLHKPALVVCVGQAGGRSDISLERVAINVDDARIADNAKQRPVDKPVVRGGPVGYFSTLPIKAMMRAMQQAECHADVSQTAGTFVCNHVFYGLMHELAHRRALKHSRGGFIHVPYMPVQSAPIGAPGMALQEMIEGLQAGLRAALSTQTDLALAGGALN